MSDDIDDPHDVDIYASHRSTSHKFVHLESAQGIARTRLVSNGVPGTFSVTVRATPPAGVPLLGAQGGFEGDDYVSELVVQTQDAGDAVASDCVAMSPARIPTRLHHGVMRQPSGLASMRVSSDSASRNASS